MLTSLVFFVASKGKKSKKFMKIVKIRKVKTHIFLEILLISMKFLGKSVTYDDIKID